MNLQERADRLVRNEVYVCLSSLVSTLAKHDGCSLGLHKGERGSELADLCEQAFELCSPVLDYEEAATQAGWSEGSVWSGHGEPIPEWSKDSQRWHSDAQSLCEHEGIDPYEREIFEHWSVSQHLADDLAALGERIDNDFAGMCVWGRTTTGQGIAQDSTIRDVLALHDARLTKLEQEEKVS